MVFRNGSATLFGRGHRALQPVEVGASDWDRQACREPASEDGAPCDQADFRAHSARNKALKSDACRSVEPSREQQAKRSTIEPDFHVVETLREMRQAEDGVQRHGPAARRLPADVRL